MYDQLVADECGEAPAVMASNGHILGTATVLATCHSLKVKSCIVLAVRILTVIAGLLLPLLWAKNAIDSYFLPAFAVMLVTALLGWLAPLFKRL